MDSIEKPRRRTLSAANRLRAAASYRRWNEERSNPRSRRQALRDQVKKRRRDCHNRCSERRQKICGRAAKRTARRKAMGTSGGGEAIIAISFRSQWNLFLHTA